MSIHCGLLCPIRTVSQRITTFPNILIIYDGDLPKVMGKRYPKD